MASAARFCTVGAAAANGTPAGMIGADDGDGSLGSGCSLWASTWNVYAVPLTRLSTVVLVPVRLSSWVTPAALPGLIRTL